MLGTAQEIFAAAMRHHQAGNFGEAEALYREVLALQPRHAQAHNNLGILLAQRGAVEAAVFAFQNAVTIEPAYVEAHNNLGNVLKNTDRIDEAIASYRRALDLQPNYALAHHNLGSALVLQGKVEQGIGFYRRAMELAPNWSDPPNSLGIAFAEIGRWDEASVAYRRALELEPGFAQAKLNLAMLWLGRGDFAHGLPLYEARREVATLDQRRFQQPEWVGEPIAGRRILVWAEQGFGDAIQFVRYANLLAGRGATVIIECREPLIELFRTVKGASEVVEKGATLPSFDLHVPILSQPLAFKTAPEDIPREVPYLFANAGRRESWRHRMGTDSHDLKVGLAWAGNREDRLLRKRHLAAEMLMPLLQVEGVQFHSLQVGPDTESVRKVNDAALLRDETENIKDFTDTAALMAELDLIISVDTAVAHLAGALALPVWTLLPFAPDWRWGLNRVETPWYPTMRLFRQPTLGDWATVIREVAKELRHKVATKLG